MSDVELNEKGYTHRLCISKLTFDTIMIECKREILKESPELKNLNLSQNYVCARIARWFLK